MNKHLYLCHPLVLCSPPLMMHGHMNLKSAGTSFLLSLPITHFFISLFLVFSCLVTFSLILALSNLGVLVKGFEISGLQSTDETQIGSSAQRV